MNEINNQQNQPKVEKQRGGCLIAVIAIIVISLAIFLIVGSLKSKNSTTPSGNGSYSNGNYSENETITKPFKKVAPSASLECTLTGIIFNIQCNDDYDYIIIRVELLDKNENVVKSFTMREDDMKKGELRQAEYKFSIGEVFTSNLVRARIEEFK